MSGGEARQAGDERALFTPPPLDAADPLFPGLPSNAAAVEAEAQNPREQIATRRPADALRWVRGRAGQRMPASIGAHIRAAATADWERGADFLLAPVCLCAGALIYFSLEQEPALYELLSVMGALVAACFLARERIVLRYLLIGLTLVALGMGAAKFETWRTGTKMLGGEISTLLTGRVARIEHQASGRVRLTIDVTETARPALKYSPERVRVTARGIPETIRTGEGVSGVVRLRPPSGPVRPGSYDFSFNSYFDGIGANGFFLTGPQPVQLGEPASWGVLASVWLERVRAALAARVRSSVGGTPGEIAAALIAGVTAGIPEQANEAMRISGIYHVISISGLHLALVAGAVMVSMRAAFALFPVFASRRPVKKYAAGIALVVVFFYLLLSGAAVATQRSFIMLAVMLSAMFFDRAALTMRNLAIAAVIVIVISPHEVAGPSFQMSFAATAALIAAYAAWSERRTRTPRAVMRDRPRIVRAARFVALYGGGIAVTSIVAGAATAFFGAWHFNRIAPLGLIANLASMPVVSLLVMPWAVAAVALMPFGLDWLPLAVMGKGITLMLAIAGWVANRSPLDEVGITPLSAVVFFSLALAILTISTTFLRAAAIPFLAAGILILAGRQTPHLLVAEDARLIAMPVAGSGIAVNRARPNGFTIENWARALMANDVVKPRAETTLFAAATPAFDALAANGFSCDAGLCIARHESGAVIAHAATPKRRCRPAASAR